MTTYLKFDRRTRLALFLLLAFAAALYLATLDNGLSPGNLEGGDLITHQYAQVQARPSNAPGYPLYTLGGWLWFHGLRALAPDANPVPLLSSYSTFWALLALACFFLLLVRVTEGNLVISLALSGFYAITYFFWFYSVTTEQYTSAVLQTLLVVALIHAWDAEPREGHLYALAFLLGLSLAHMVTVLFIAPGALLFLLWKQPELLKRGRLIIRSLAIALAPLLSYVFIYIRGAQHPEWRGAGQWSSTWQWFLSFLSTQQGRDELTWSLGPFTDEFPRLIWVELTPLLLILGGVGWALMGRRWGRRYTAFYGLTAVIYLLFSYIDRYGNWFQVIMPLYPLVLLGAGVTLAGLWRRSSQRTWRAALLLLLAALLILKFADSYPRANQYNRPEDTGLAPGQIILASEPPPHAAIICEVREKLALDYLTGIWGLRPDVQAISTTEAAEALAQGRPLLVTSAAASYAAAESGLPLRYSSWGPGLLLASPDALPQPPMTGFAAQEQPLGDGLYLLGYRLAAGRDSGVWELRLALLAKEKPQRDWALSVRLLRAGVELAQQDHPHPAEGLTPTSSLEPGDVVHDAFRFELDPALEPDGFRLLLYRVLPDGGFENLTDRFFARSP